MKGDADEEAQAGSDVCCLSAPKLVAGKKKKKRADSINVIDFKRRTHRIVAASQVEAARDMINWLEAYCPPVETAAT